MIRAAYRLSRLVCSLPLLAALAVTTPASASGQQAVANPHGTLPEGLDCSGCHTAEGWNVLREPLGFEHGEKSAQLMVGAHAEAQCAGCHLNVRFDGPDMALANCAACHADVHQGQMGQGCIDCHTPMSFADLDGELIHARTAFPLTGAHMQVTCESCHVSDVGGAFSPRATDCAACHLPAYEAAQPVDHVASGYPTDCAQCHSTLAWEDTAPFDHAASSNGFGLIGAHSFLQCASCHALPGMETLFTATDPTDCVACHLPDYDREHGGTDVPITCLTCHTADSWDAEDFDHALLGFKLLGGHAGLECSSCHTADHKGLRFSTPAGESDCAACHQADYDGEHAGSGYPVTCLTCHNLEDWDGAAFNHGTTAFPLEGAHTSVGCADCHGPPAHLSAAFRGAGECTSCHQTDYDTNHAGSGFPSTCLSCHTQTTWSFDHVGLQGGFTLGGPHETAACESCHTVPDYGLRFPLPAGPEDCVSCHRVEYDANHAGSGIATTCLSCHTGDQWTDPAFDHTANTGFALVDSHQTAACESCHNRPDYSLKFPVPATQEDCASCHQTDYDTNHAGSGFPTACLGCHTQTTWQGAAFDHGGQTGFTLLGPHAPLACTTCHAVPGYALLFPQPANADDCVACHQGDYDANHVGSGFPTTCLTCHGRDAWSGATVDHVTIGNGFALLGAHAVATCATCHAMPGYGLLFPPPSGQNDCRACHQPQHASAHSSSVYYTDCAACHTVNAWEPSPFDHDAQHFPIYSGKHREAWNDCGDCHGAPTTLGVFSCLTCHEHNQTSMNDKHKGRIDYVYDSGACLSCHPTGKAD